MTPTYTKSANGRLEVITYTTSAVTKAQLESMRTTVIQNILREQEQLAKIEERLAECLKLGITE